MTPGIALIIIGALALISGWKNQPLTAIFAGSDEKSPGGSPPIVEGGIQSTYGEGVSSDATGTVSTGVVPGVGHVDTTGVATASPNVLRGLTQFDHIPVAKWIAPQLQWARDHGWAGTVTSGWRDPTEVITPSAGLPVAPQGQSNHGKTAYPGGAVDVTDPDGLERVLRGYPNPLKLRRGTAIGDPIHFSATGR